MKIFDLNFNKIASLVLLIACIIMTMMSCSKFRYVTRNLNATIVIDSVQVIEEISEKSIEKDSKGIYIVQSYSKDSVLISIVRYKDTINYIQTGESRYCFQDGKIKRIENYNDNGFLDGRILTYYHNGTTKRDDLYNSDSLISGKCYDSLGNEIKYFKCYVEPSIDLKQFQSCLVYPENLRRQDIEERLILQVLINKKGEIVKIKYDNNHSPAFVVEAVKCALKAKITPSYIDGEPIPIWIHIPITFRLR
jgi:hypothetical protein